MLDYKYYSIVVRTDGAPQYKAAYIRKDAQQHDVKYGRPSMPRGLRFIPVSRDEYCKSYFDFPTY